MKKILITRKLLRSNEEKASKLWEAKLNLNDELYSQSKLVELSQGCDGILTSLTDKMDEATINKLPDTIGPFAGGNYYLSSNFENNLPEGYQSSGAFDEDGDLIIENINNRKQVLIKENEPLPAVKAKLRSIASSREKFFRDNN